MFRLRYVLLIAIFSFFSPGDSADAGSDFEKSTLTIITKSGEHRFSVELAETPRQRAQGLQGRSKLPPGTGMLFDFKADQPVTMWMKNTPISLDMLFIAADGAVVNIASGTEPLSLKYITSDGPVRAVLEVLAGTVRVLGVRKGDRIANHIFDTPK